MEEETNKCKKCGEFYPIDWKPRTHAQYCKMEKENMEKEKAKAMVWCRNCGKEMQQAPYRILAFYCKKCKLKAKVRYEPTPIIKLQES